MGVQARQARYCRRKCKSSTVEGQNSETSPHRPPFAMLTMRVKVRAGELQPTSTLKIGGRGKTMTCANNVSRVDGGKLWRRAQNFVLLRYTLSVAGFTNRHRQIFKIKFSVFGYGLYIHLYAFRKLRSRFVPPDTIRKTLVRISGVRG